MKRKLIASLLVLCLAFSVGLAQAQVNGTVCPTITFLNVTSDTFECMKKKLQDEGNYVPPGNSGELSLQGATGTFEWDGNSTLTVNITQKPFFISCEMATNEITKFVKDCYGS